MSFNKRKIFVLDTSNEDDSFKRRRSSLRVNLSYCENLTDSGNGSLLKTEIEADKKETDTAQTNKKLSRSKRNNIYDKNHQFDSDNGGLQIQNDISKLTLNKSTDLFPYIKKGIQLKQLTVNLEDINIKERALEVNCKRLKDAILNKTKEIFDRENELSKKTAMILKNEENCFAGDINDANKSITTLDTMTDHQLRNKAIMEHEKYTNISTNQQKDNQYSNIISTPTNSNKLDSSKRAIDKSRLTQRRLFTEEDNQIEGQAKCRIIEDIVLKEKFPSFRQTDRSDSPILSGYNRKFGLLRRQTMLHSQKQSEIYNATYSTIPSQNIDIGLPIVCSTFNEDNMMGENENNSLYNKANSDMDTSCAMHTTNKVISMEMTEVHGGIQMSEKHLSSQNTNLNTSGSIENSKKMETKKKSVKQSRWAIQMQGIENMNSLVDKSMMQNNNAHFDLSNTNVDRINNQNTVISMQASNIKKVTIQKKDRPQIHQCNNKTKKHNERHGLFLSDSDNTIRSSLNVNTSLDAVIETNKEQNIQKINDYKMNNGNQDFKAAKINNEELITLDDQYESSNITETSMKMNTSVNSMREIQQRGSSRLQSFISNKSDEDTTENHLNMDNRHSLVAKNEEANNVDFLEHISLLQRLTNISTQNQVPYNNRLKVSKMKEKVRTENRSNNVEFQSSEYTSNNGDSYIEGTPYPISRSVLFKTRLKYKTQNLDSRATSCSNNLNLMDNKENIDKTKSDALYSKTAEINTVILEDTSNSNPSITQNQLRVINDTIDETRLETNEKNTVATDNIEYTSVRKGRRKLLPLNENSQLCSITPIKEDKCIDLEESTKKTKKLRKKHPKRKSINYKNDTSSIKRNIIYQQTRSDNDYNISKDKKKKDKKIQKPRKVVSKKIVIKKIADEDVLNILKKNRQEKVASLENRDSLDDFVKHRTIPIHWNKYKSQKIVIAMTGLSKGDKSLVKSIVKSLGMAEIELNISRRTTHVVSTGVRTVNLLRAIIRGCWLVTLEWVLKSLENNGWLNPEEFEMKHFSKAVQENRKDRQLFGPSYIPELFATCGLIYVGHKTTMPCDTLKELIKTAGGHITENIKLAKIIIDMNGLKETWIIDSITTGELQLNKLYERK